MVMDFVICVCLTIIHQYYFCESLLKLPKVSWNLKLTHYKIEILIQQSDYTSLLILNPSWYVGLGRELLLQYLTTHLPMREMSEMWVRPLGQEEPLEKGMASHSSILAWRIPPAEEPGGLQSIGLQSQTWLKWLSTHVHNTKPWGLLSLWLSRKTISERYQQGNAVKTGGKPPSLYSQERTKQVLNNYSSFVLL